MFTVVQIILPILSTKVKVDKTTIFLLSGPEADLPEQPSFATERRSSHHQWLLQKEGWIALLAHTRQHAPHIFQNTCSYTQGKGRLDAQSVTQLSGTGTHWRNIEGCILERSRFHANSVTTNAQQGQIWWSTRERTLEKNRFRANSVTTNV